VVHNDGALDEAVAQLEQVVDRPPLNGVATVRRRRRKRKSPLQIL